MDDNFNIPFSLQYAPFIPQNPIIIDQQWFERQKQWIQQKLTEIYPNMKLQQISIPHEKYNIEYDETHKFLQVIRDLFDLEYYQKYLQNFLVLPLSEQQKNQLKDVIIKPREEECPLISSSGTKPNLEELTEFKSEFPKIEEFINQNQEVFVKLSQKSAKNDFKIYGAKDVQQVFDNIVHSYQVYSCIDMSKSIVLRKFYKLNKENEYRVFIYNSKIIAISQQYIGFPIKQNMGKWDKLIQKLKTIVNEDFIYTDAVLDVNYENDNIIIFDINPGCSWGSSGKCLFYEQEMYEIEQNSFNNQFQIQIRIYLNKKLYVKEYFQLK